MIRDNIILYRNYAQLNVRCFCCNYNNHIAKDCPMVHVIINPERVIRDHIKVEPTNRRQFPRFSKKFKVLKNLESMIRACIKLHRTTTLEMSTVTVEQEEEDEEEEDEELPAVSPFRNNLSPFGKFGSQCRGVSIPKIRSKASMKSVVPEDNTSDELEKIKRADRKNRSAAMTSLNFGGSMTTGFTGAFETYINNMNAIMENDRINSPLFRKKNTTHFHTQTTIPRSSNLLEEGLSLSPRKKKTQLISESETRGKFTEHQKMVAEALMLQGISTPGQQDNYLKLSYNEMLNQFDKMKSFELYFPYNNVEVIVEILKNAQKNSLIKRRKSRYRKRNSSVSPQDYHLQNFSSFYNQMSFKQILKGETLHTHNSNYNYEDLMYRRALTQNEGSPAKKLRLLPTKSINYSKGITTLKANLRKCQTLKKKIKKNKCFWVCLFCKNKEFKIKD